MAGDVAHAPFVIVDGSQMLAAAAISLPYVFVSRAIFPGAEDQQKRSLEEHYLKHRHLILVMLAIPTIVSVASHMLLDGVRYHGWEAWWVAARIAAPLPCCRSPASACSAAAWSRSTCSSWSGCSANRRGARYQIGLRRPNCSRRTCPG